MPQKSFPRACFLVLSLGCAQLAGGALADQAHHTVVPGDAVKWGPAPASLPSGAQAAILLGNPAKAKAKLGWSPKTSLEQLVAMMVDAEVAREQGRGE